MIGVVRRHRAVLLDRTACLIGHTGAADTLIAIVTHPIIITVTRFIGIGRESITDITGTIAISKTRLRYGRPIASSCGHQNKLGRT